MSLRIVAPSMIPQRKPKLWAITDIPDKDYVAFIEVIKIKIKTSIHRGDGKNSN